MYLAEISTPPSPGSRPNSLHTASNNQFYGNNSPKIVSPLLPSPLKAQSPHHTFNQNVALMSMMQQQQQQKQPYLHHHHVPNSYGTYNNSEALSNENQQIFDG